MTDRDRRERLTEYVAVLREFGRSDEEILAAHDEASLPDGVSLPEFLDRRFDHAEESTLYERLHDALATGPAGIDAEREYWAHAPARQLDEACRVHGWRVDLSGEDPFTVTTEAPDGDTHESRFTYPASDLGQYNYPALAAAVAELLDGLTFALLTDRDGRWRFVCVETDRLATLRERYGEGRLRLMPVGLVTDGNGETLVYPVDKGSGATTSLVEADGVVAVDPDTEYLGEGEAVDVQLFSPDVRAPTLLVVGEDGPALSRLLDRLDNPRFLPVGSREGLRRLGGGVPDAAVVAGPVERDVDSVDLGGWTREWGLVVPAGNPDEIEGLADLADRDLSFVNRGRDAGVRASLDAAIDGLAAERDVSRADLTGSIRGYDIGSKGFESPARVVARGDADVGLGLRATAEKLGLGFVSLGTESVRIRANPNRTGKPGVEELSAELEDGSEEDVFASLAGYKGE